MLSGLELAVTNKSNMASYFPKRGGGGEFKWQQSEMCPDVAGPSSSCSNDLFELSDRSNKTDLESLTRATYGWTPAWI